MTKNMNAHGEPSEAKQYATISPSSLYIESPDPEDGMPA
jgi:hypothetical protein